jgi:hypothetical protein
MNRLAQFRLLCLLALSLSIVGCQAQSRPTTIEQTTYLGKPAYRIASPTAEAIVVPELGGRVMAFNLAGQPNIIWNNPDTTPDKAGFVNWGGDKTFVGPHYTWGEFTESIWPPKPGYDPLVYTAQVKGTTLVLTSPVWEDFGMVVTRVISLDRDTLSITSTMENTDGPVVTCGLWQVAQVNPPYAVTLQQCPKAGEKGYITLGREPKASEVKLEDGWVVITPEYVKSTKVGSHAGSPRVIVARYEDDTVLVMHNQTEPGVFLEETKAAPIELYFNGGDKRYAELESLTAPRPMPVGASASMTTSLTLRKVK